MARAGPELSDGELEVLKVLWEERSNTVREVMERLHAQGRRLAYTTVLTFLTRLEQKGYVKSDKAGLAYIYRPKHSRDAVIRSKLRELADQLFDGAMGTMVLQLMKTERFTEAEISQFRSLIESLDGEDDSPAQKRSRDRGGSTR